MGTLNLKASHKENFVFPLRTYFDELLKNVRPPQHRIEAAQELPPLVREYIKQSKEFPTVYPHTRLAGSYPQKMGAGDVKDVGDELTLDSMGNKDRGERRLHPYPQLSHSMPTFLSRVLFKNS